jgi:subtilisin family serine protease
MKSIRLALVFVLLAAALAAAGPQLEFAATDVWAPAMARAVLATTWRVLATAGDPFLVRFAEDTTISLGDGDAAVTWLALVPPRGAIALARSADVPLPAEVAWCGTLPPEAKLGAALARRTNPATAVRVRRANQPITAVAITPQRDLAAWLGDPAVWVVDAARPKLAPANHNVRHVTGAEFAQTSADWDLSGQGVILAVVDEGRVLHPDLGGRLGSYTAADLSEHATHVSGTVAGNGDQSDGLYRGLAPEATLLVWDFSETVDKLPTLVDLGVRQVNNSWVYFLANSEDNCEYLGAYDAFTAEYDKAVYGADRAPLAVAFAAGNMGGSSDCGIAERDDYASLPPPGTGKNVLTVGSADGGLRVSWFSSRGPTTDGRVKPDIMAAGCMQPDPGHIVSTMPLGGYAGTGWCGTSMATPQTTGAAGLLFELADRLGVELSPAATKALLLAGARDMAIEGPDFNTGWGHLDVVASVVLLQQDALVEGNIASQSETWSLEFEAPAETARLELTLVWTDPAAVESAEHVLVNDLELRLVSPDGQAHLPWVLDADEPLLGAKLGADHVNNIERVSVVTPEPGTWRIEVRAENLLTPQPFVVAGWPLAAEACDLDGDNSPGPQCAGNDCDDADPTRRPGIAEELGNGIDEDCDGLVDESFPGVSPDGVDTEEPDDDDDDEPSPEPAAEDDDDDEDSDDGCGC